MSARVGLGEGVSRAPQREGCNGWSKIERAQFQSDQAIARVQGMKLRAELDPPRPAQGSFPYAHRTCAEWKQSRWILPLELSDDDRRVDARRGSRRLAVALRKALERG